MVHISPDYPTKKAFKQAIVDGKIIMVYSAGGIFPCPQDGRVAVEAPAHFHKWYASVEIKGGQVVKVLG
jgi:hypothetical protein